MAELVVKKQMINSVLLIDDDRVTNFLHERLIKKLIPSKEISIASNGAEAIQFLNQRITDGKQYPNLIFLDINMPIMDGFEFLENFEKIRLENSSIIILMLTTSSNENDVQKAKELKINGYLNKPLTEEKIKHIIDIHFK